VIQAVRQLEIEKMSNKCEMCGKQKVSGGTITRMGLAIKAGGIGMHVVKNNKRTFFPNIQEIRVKTDKGNKRMKVCTSCIRTGNFEKA
jgi:large subunit ribosomal protein L28